MTTCKPLNHESTENVWAEEEIEGLIAMHPDLRQAHKILMMEGRPPLERLSMLQEFALEVLRGNPEAEVAKFRDALKECEKPVKIK